MSDNVTSSNPPTGAAADATAPSLMDRLKRGVDGEAQPMTFMEHLLELRQRLWFGLMAMVACMTVALAYYDKLFSVLRWPVDRLNVEWAEAYALAKAAHPETARLTQITLISTDPMDTLMMVMWLSIGVGLVLGSPVLLYQAWAFISPGLRVKEQRAIKPVLYGGIFFFLAGAAIAYFVLFPVSIKFFSALNVELGVTSQWTVEKYSSLLLNMMGIAGLICETPLVIAALAKLSIVQPAHLTGHWRFCVFLSFILGAIFSPGQDIMSMILFSGLLLSLYVISVFMAYAFYPKAKSG